MNTRKEDVAPPVESAGDGLVSIRSVADTTGISAYTIRYYDKCGFFPGLYRDKNKKRWFSSNDIEQLHLIDALRKSGLSIEGIQYFVRLQRKGDSTKTERAHIIESQTTVLAYQLEEISQSLDVLKRYEDRDTW